MKRLRILWLAAVAGFAWAVLSTQAQETIKIGEFGSLTGSEASFGVSSHNGSALAFEGINAKGGVLGRKIELICEDDQSKAGQAATVVRKLISSDHVVAVLGEVASSRSLEAAPICQDSKIPMISPASTNPKVTQVGDYIFRVCFIDPFQGKVMANFATHDLKATRVAMLIDEKSDYSIGLSDAFRKQFAANGGQLVLERSFASHDKDFRGQLTAIKAANPEAVFVPGYYTEVGLIVRQARSLGLKIPLFGGDGWETSNLGELGGSAIEGCFFSTHFNAENKDPAAQDFVAKFKAKYDHAPDAMAALGYDAAIVAADAIKRAGTTDPAKLRDAIAATKNVQGCSGLITLDEQRNATKAAVILKMTNGKAVFYETVAP